ncbi:hypothetical protein Slin15195_G120180 [Septoria linicola]|uniref:Uncharacterized protein n=1 Tax=Septoria linicola TaxID=215465 RepID=A0A9Q9B0G7_9PEZI|nr:hypothetical protein Slin15195_G120180 [Septoria linicola]
MASHMASIDCIDRVRLLPISAILTPASLSVVFENIQPASTEYLRVPQPAFESLQFIRPYVQSQSENVSHFESGGPHHEVMRIAFAAVTQGAILPISPPGPDATWELQVRLPRLKALNSTTYGREFGGDMGPAWFMFSHLAWSSQIGLQNEFPLPFEQSERTGEWELTPSVLESEEGQSQNLAVAVFPQAVNRSFVTQISDINPFDGTSVIDLYFEEATLLYCDMAIGDYTLQFAYNDTLQSQHVIISSMESH